MGILKLTSVPAPRTHKAKTEAFNTRNTTGGRCVNVPCLYPKLFFKGGVLNVAILKKILLFIIHF